MYRVVCRTAFWQVTPDVSVDILDDDAWGDLKVTDIKSSPRVPASASARITATTGAAASMIRKSPAPTSAAAVSPSLLPPAAAAAAAPVKPAAVSEWGDDDDFGFDDEIVARDLAK